MYSIILFLFINPGVSITVTFSLIFIFINSRVVLADELTVMNDFLPTEPSKLFISVLLPALVYPRTYTSPTLSFSSLFSTSSTPSFFSALITNMSFINVSSFILSISFLAFTLFGSKSILVNTKYTLVFISFRGRSVFSLSVSALTK